MNKEQMTIEDCPAPILAKTLLPVSTVFQECFHNWEYGYVSDLIIYCTKCNKEIEDIYDKSVVSYSTHTCIDGKIEII